MVSFCIFRLRIFHKCQSWLLCCLCWLCFCLHRNNQHNLRQSRTVELTITVSLRNIGEALGVLDEKHRKGWLTEKEFKIALSNFAGACEAYPLQNLDRLATSEASNNLRNKTHINLPLSILPPKCPP